MASHPARARLSLVLVNGEVTIRDDQQTQRHPGVLLRHGGATPAIADDTAHRRVAA
jgi:hypothetical protein